MSTGHAKNERCKEREREREKSKRERQGERGRATIIKKSYTEHTHHKKREVEDAAASCTPHPSEGALHRDGLRSSRGPATPTKGTLPDPLPRGCPVPPPRAPPRAATTHAALLRRRHPLPRGRPPRSRYPPPTQPPRYGQKKVWVGLPVQQRPHRPAGPPRMAPLGGMSSSVSVPPPSWPSLPL